MKFERWHDTIAQYPLASKDAADGEFPFFTRRDQRIAFNAGREYGFRKARKVFEKRLLENFQIDDDCKSAD